MGDDNTQRIDYSPSSGAVDASDAAYDQGESTKVGRFQYMDNATSIGDEIPAPSQAANSWSDDDDIDGVHYQTLNQLNRQFTGTDTTHIEQRRRAIDNRNDVYSWGRHIGLSTPEIMLSVEMMDRCSTGIKRSHGIDTLNLAALTLAANDVDVTTKKSIRDNGIDTGHHDLVTNYENIRDALDIDRPAVTTARIAIKSEM